MSADCDDATEALYHQIDTLTRERDDARAEVRHLKMCECRRIAAAPEAFYRTLDREGWLNFARACGLRPPKHAQPGRIKERVTDLGVDGVAQGVLKFIFEKGATA